jgi:hypothetical protein
MSAKVEMLDAGFSILDARFSNHESRATNHESVGAFSSEFSRKIAENLVMTHFLRYLQYAGVT